MAIGKGGAEFIRDGEQVWLDTDGHNPAPLSTHSLLSTAGFPLEIFL